MSVTADQYQSWIRRNLENPQRLWEHPYREHLNQSAKNLVNTLFFLPDQTGVKLVEVSFDKLNSSVAREHNMATDPEDFRRAMQETSGSFINVVNGLVSFANPSLRDFLDHALSGTNVLLHVLNNIVKSDQARFVDQHIQATATAMI